MFDELELAAAGLQLGGQTNLCVNFCFSLSLFSNLGWGDVGSHDVLCSSLRCIWSGLIEGKLIRRGKKLVSLSVPPSGPSSSSLCL